MCSNIVEGMLTIMGRHLTEDHEQQTPVQQPQHLDKVRPNINVNDNMCNILKKNLSVNRYFCFLFTILTGLFVNPLAAPQYVPTSTGFAMVPGMVLPPSFIPFAMGVPPTVGVSTATTTSVTIAPLPSSAVQQLLSTTVGSQSAGGTHGNITTTAASSVTQTTSSLSWSITSPGYFTPPSKTSTPKALDVLKESPTMERFVAKTKEKKHMKSPRAQSEGY